MNADHIEKKILLKAPLAQVWRAIADAKNFGAWFGVAFDGPFIAGQLLTGRIVPTTVDPEIAKLQKTHESKRFELVVKHLSPMRLFSFRWHPFAIDPAVDYSQEPMTLVSFELEEVPGGTQLTIREAGFDRIPLARRAAALKANDDGWAHQARLIEKYLARQAGT